MTVKSRTASPPDPLPPSPAPARGAATREALVAAATEVFGRRGFEAVTTREIADRAGANQALIGYYFGGKEGLYLAVFESITAQLREAVTPQAARIAQLLEQPPPPGASAAALRKRWLPPILDVVDAMVALMLSPKTQHWAQLMLREQSHPTAAFDRLYDGFQGPVLQLIAQLVMRLRPDQDAEDARLRVVAMLGEVIAWRATRATALRLLGWQEPDEAAMPRIRESVRRSVTALLLA